jgi:putative FmdB family regulatory protein
MPTYVFKCITCGGTEERFLKLTNYTDPQQCGCGGALERQLTAPVVRGDYPGYECPVTGSWIEGRKAHQENLRRHGCRILEPGETASHKQSLVRGEESLDKALDETADSFIANLPAVKREKLVGELEGGLTATVERR